MDYVFEPPVRASLPLLNSRQRYPIRRIYCVGRNYRAHALEMGQNPDREAPFFFGKPADAILADGGTLRYPSRCRDLHHEVELVVALGSGGSGLRLAESEAAIFGYAVGIDFTRRDLQAAAKKKGQPWDTAKGFDGSAAVGALTPVHACGYLHEGEISLSVNGDRRQRADLGDMIWRVSEIVAELSTFFELKAGDLIFTGTPAGVSSVQAGDRLQARVAGLVPLEVSVQG